MDVNDIPIEIVDNLNFSEDDKPEITKDYKGCDIFISTSQWSRAQSSCSQI